MEEVWKLVEGYQAYFVSTCGRVKGKSGKLLKPRHQKGGYLKVSLSANGKVKDYQIHRLVAKAFIGNKFNHPEVNHIDENKQNNSVQNLEWCSHKYNSTYGTMQMRRLESRDYSDVSIPVVQLDESGMIVNVFHSQSQAARAINVSSSQICFACKHPKARVKGFTFRATEGCL